MGRKSEQRTFQISPVNTEEISFPFALIIGRYFIYVGSFNLLTLADLSDAGYRQKSANNFKLKGIVLQMGTIFTTDRYHRIDLIFHN